MPYPDFPIPQDELERQRDLERQGILNHPGDEHFDRLVRLTATVLETPIALISLVDGERQWFLAHHGLDASQTPRQMAFCAHAIACVRPNEFARLCSAHAHVGSALASPCCCRGRGTA